MSAKDRILGRLRAVQQPFADVPPVESRRNMVPLADQSLETLKARFIQEADKASMHIHHVADHEAAIEQILSLIGDDQAISRWDSEQIGIPGLEEALDSAGIQRADTNDGSIRVGLTGADAALAATGSLVIGSGSGRSRLASLVPSAHVAVLRESQIVADLETWFEQQRAAGLDDFRETSNITLITGSSRTADIAQELILGAHGPTEVHIILLAD